jgi:AraC-like DNA-binding protein
MNDEELVVLGFYAGIILMAFLHGMLLASIFLFHKRLNAKSNKYLALAILGICVILAYEFFLWLDMEAYIPLWIQYLPLYIRSTIPIGIFYFVIFLIQPEHKLSNFERLGFVAIGMEVFLESMNFPINLLFESPEQIEVAEDLIVSMGWFIGVIAPFVFLPVALMRVNQYQKSLYDNYSTTVKKSLAWLKFFLVIFMLVNVLLMISFGYYIMGDLEKSELVFAIVTICFVLLLFWIGYFVMIYYSWFEIVPLIEDETVKEITNNKLSSNTITYYKQLKSLLLEEKVYEDINLTLDSLAERLQISSGYLSQIIKENEQKNFFELINYYRIESVKKKLLDQNYKDYTIMSIALESGFNSKSTFNAVFKKFTNQTPSAFRRKQVVS